jgi:hypothetical protein
MQHAAHAHALCGAHVSINMPFDWDAVRYPSLSAHPVHRACLDETAPVPDDFCASTVMPDDALLATLVVCDGGATFVQTQHSPGHFSMARPDYSMRGIVPEHSVLQAFVYNNHQGNRLLGLFDASSIAGQDLSNEPPLVRHGKVFELYHQAAASQQVPAHIVHHGVYYESACLALDLARLHFATSRVLRLPLSMRDPVCEHFCMQAPLARDT